jgi:tRNA G18 (ribose-2'-O)-methylase SpoU
VAIGRCRPAGAQSQPDGGSAGGLATARNRTIIVLGHDQSGIPPEAMDLVDIVVEIPMVGTSATLNVASPAR